jgi:PAS domain-containing protein
MRRKAATASVLGSGAVNLVDTVLDALPQGVLVLDADLRVLRANPRYNEIAAGPPEEAVGRALPELSGGLWDVPARASADRPRTHG